MSITETSTTNPTTLQHLVADVYDDGYLRVEHDNYYVACAGQRLKLPRTEFLILSRLVKSIGRFVTSEELWSSAWGETKPLNPESLHVYIHRLRFKVSPHGLTFETMVNVGYCLTLNRTAP